MKPFDHFDFIAPMYEKYAKTNPPLDLLAYLDLSAESLVLDVGGGTGRIASSLVQNARHVLVADPSFKMLSFASKKPGLNPFQTPGETLPFESNTFDAVIMVDAFHHVIDQNACLLEMYRVTKPGGKLVVQEPDIKTFYVKLIALGEKILLMRSHIRSGEEIAGLLADCCTQSAIFRKDYSVYVVLKK